MKKILVTGGAGYIGSILIRVLKEEGFDVVVVDNFSEGHKEATEGFKVYELDLVKNVEKLEKVFEKEKFDAVIHIASFIQMGESFKNPSKYFRNNLIGVLNVLDVMRKFDVGKFVFSSSAGVYGDAAVSPISENASKNPINPYGETKYMIEKILSWYDLAYGIKFISIRYFNAAGAFLDGEVGEDHPNESHLIPLAIKAAMEGREFTINGNDYETPDGTCVRDYIHVLDLASSHVLALNSLLKSAKSNFYNAGIGKGYSNSEVIGAIKKATGLNLRVRYGERRPGDTAVLFASNGKIKRELGWKSKYDLKEIVESAYLWHKKHPRGWEK